MNAPHRTTSACSLIKGVRVALSVGCLAIAAAPVEAKLEKRLQWDFEATVLQIIDPGGLFAEMRVGDPARGTLTLDVHDEEPLLIEEFIASYSQPHLGGVASLIVDNPRNGERFEFLPDGSGFLPWADLSVVNDDPEEKSDALFFLQSVAPPPGFQGVDPILEVDFIGPPGGLRDLRVPSKLELEDWPVATVAFYDFAQQDPFGTTVVAEIYSLTPAPQPSVRPLIVSDFMFDSIIGFAPQGDAFLGTFDTVPELDGPRGIVVDGQDRLYVAGRNSSNVVRYDAMTGQFIDEFITSGAGGLGTAGDVLIAADGSVLVTSSSTSRILRYDGATGEFINEFASSPGSGFLYMAQGPDGFLYVGEFFNNRVSRYDMATGALVDVFAEGGGLVQPWGLAFGPDGDLFVASGLTHEVLRYDGASGEFLGAFVNAGSGGLDTPRGLAFGPDGHLYVTSNSRSGILRFDGLTGEYLDDYLSDALWGLITPMDLVFMPANPPNADFDGNGWVDGDDLGRWEIGFGVNEAAEGDADHDGDVDGADFLAWQRQFSPGPDNASAVVPEPTGAALLAAAISPLLYGRRRRISRGWQHGCCADEARWRSGGPAPQAERRAQRPH